MTIYYTEYPTGTFTAKSDSAALKKSRAGVVYRESDTPDGRPFVILRDPNQKEETKMKKPKPLSLDEEIVLSCAARYALGRRTYVVHSVCSELIRNYAALPDGTRRRIAQEIQEHQDKWGPAGDECDDREWNRVKWLFDPTNRVRIRAQHAGTGEWSEHEAIKAGGHYWSVPDVLQYHTAEEISQQEDGTNVEVAS